MSEKLFQLLLDNSHHYQHCLPKKSIVLFFKELYGLFFPCYRESLTREEYDKQLLKVKDIFCSILECFDSFDDKKKKQLFDDFFSSLPQIYEGLMEDVSILKEYDPAAYSHQEIISSYPGFYAVAAYRISHRIDELGITMVPRLISEYAHSITGVDIHPKASIGRRLFIDHGTGVVIGATTNICNNVKIYQGVTLGAKNVFFEKNVEKRHPTIEDDVIVYANATILGGDTVIGKGSIIGGNVWLTKSVAPESMVYNDAQLAKIRRK